MRMTNWKYNVYLADLFEEFYDASEEGEGNIKKVVMTTLDRLMLLKNKIKKDDDDPDSLLKGLGGLDFITDDFEFFDYELDYEEQIEKFDEIMNDLYDFADYNYVWINTMDRNLDGVGKP
jgi:hypothetical protein